MKLAIHQPQYMPWVGYFHKLASCDLFVYLDDVQFKKNEWQHRNRVRCAIGAQWLSVPNTYAFPQTIREVAILNSPDWRRKHLQSLRTCYGAAPFFATRFPLFEAFYAREWITIDKCNIDSTELLASMLGINTRREVSSRHRFEGSATLRLVNICRHFGASTYLAGAGGHDYMDLPLFAQAGIDVEFQAFTPPVYSQRFCRTPADFIAGLSAIDLVFNCGDRSLEVLMAPPPHPVPPSPPSLAFPPGGRAKSLPETGEEEGEKQHR